MPTPLAEGQRKFICSANDFSLASGQGGGQMMLTMIELTTVEMMTVTLLGVVMMVVMLMMIVATNLKGRERAEQDRKKGGN